MAPRHDEKGRRDAQKRLRRRIGGGLWGYAFAASLAAHLILWGILAMPHDDAGLRWDNPAVTAPIAPEQVKRVLAGQPVGEAASPYSRAAYRVASGRHGGDAAPSGADAASPANTALSVAGGGRHAVAADAGGPLENTRSQTRRLADAMARAGDGALETPPPRPPTAGGETASAYIDGGGKVRGAAAASSGATIALENEAMMAALRRDYKAAQEDAKPEAARPALGLPS